MSKTAFVLGAGGQVGRAVIESLLADGWRVRAGGRSTHRWPATVEGVPVDRDSDASLRAALGGGADVLVDCIGYTEAHARQLLSVHGLIGSAVVLSTVSVYADAAGRTLDEATGPDDFPDYPAGVTEDQVRTQPGDATYSTRKVALENVLLDPDAPLPVTVLRPGAISGPGSVHPRELWFVKRALDRRTVQLLDWDGQSRFHTSSTVNLAELVRLAANRPGRRVLNAVDPAASSTSQIGAAINRILDHRPTTIEVPGAPGVGETPWSVPRPFVMDMTKATQELGYRAVASYADTLPATVDWIAAELAGRAWQEVFPDFLRANGPGAFDYAAEDAWLRRARS